MPFIKLLLRRLLRIEAEAKLVEVNLETIIFKKGLVIWGVVVHFIRRRCKPRYNQAPPAVALAEINGPIHGFHSLFFQPAFACIKKEVGSFLVIDAFKKTNSSCWLAFLF